MWSRFKAVFEAHPALIIGSVVLVALLFYVMMKPSSAPGTTAVSTGPSDAAVQANAAETLAQINQQANADNNATAVGVAQINAGAAATIAQLQAAADTTDSNNQLAAILASVQAQLGIAQSTNNAAVSINSSNNAAAMHINDTNAGVSQTLGLAGIGLSSHEADLSNQLANASLNSNTPISIGQNGDTWMANIGVQGGSGTSNPSQAAAPAAAPAPDNSGQFLVQTAGGGYAYVDANGASTYASQIAYNGYPGS